ncbi:MAG: ABC transporter ATP-binding protein [Verrucomicrobiota bacterium]|nr:ABC transporter ATP-binding protein [Verrucomicrobiota bacterium]
MPIIELLDATKRYGDGPVVLESLSLKVERGEFVALLGPSGCGKSTLLRVVAGLSPLTSGAVTVAGSSPEHAREKMAFIFQEATLLPWLTVQGNVEVPLRLRHETKETREARASALLELVGLATVANYYPRQLSGGMKMRVSLARALTLSPEVILLDEPFGALDAMTRNRLNEELLRLREAQRWTALFVTHSVQEAVFLSSKIVLLGANPGRIHRVLENPLPYPRTAETRETDGFQQLSARLAAELRQTPMPTL